MPLIRSLLILFALLSPALGQDGSRMAASAKDAAQALQLYLDGVSKSGGRPDYTKPPASDLFRRVFDLEQLAALPPPKSSDMIWLLEWADAATRAHNRILYFGQKPGAALDRTIFQRNLGEYEDQYAAAMNFMIRLTARETTTLSMFMGQLSTEQRTPIREAGLRKARDGAAEMITGTIISVAQGMKPDNARLLTAAMRDTRDVWATFILPKDQSQIMGLLTKARSVVKDDDVKKNLATFADALTTANTETLKRYRLAADRGDADAQRNLGAMYEKGQGVTRNDAKAAKWYRLAADQGDAKAQRNLGVMYEKGQGVTQNDAEAAKWYRLAAAQNLSDAQNNLGNMYETGRGVTQDYAEAVKWYRLAAKQGLATAQYNLGIMYDNGHGVTRNYAEAAKWYRLAAAQGDADAQYSLGVLYDNGNGVPQDDTEAAKWFHLAADQGYAKAQNNLGTLFARGQGVPRDYVQAYMWFDLSAAQGNPPAVRNREAAAGLMTSSQIAEAKKLARGRKPKPER